MVPDTGTTDREGALPELGPCVHNASRSQHPKKNVFNNHLNCSKSMTACLISDEMEGF